MPERASFAILFAIERPDRSSASKPRLTQKARALLVITPWLERAGIDGTPFPVVIRFY